MSGAGFLLISASCELGSSGSFPDGAGVEGNELGGEALLTGGACPAAPVLLLRALCAACMFGLGSPGGPYGPGLMDLGGAGRPLGPAASDGGTGGNCAGEMGRWSGSWAGLGR